MTPQHIESLIIQANTGDLHAQQSLYSIYTQYGQFDDAKRYLLLADAQGCPVAAYNLAMLYKNGMGQEINYALAAEYYRKAASRNIIQSFSNLGFLYSEGGYGLQKDLSEAARWFLDGAERGDPMSQYNLGLMYESGDGVIKDGWQANNYFNMAANAGLDAAQFRLGMNFLNGNGVDPNEKFAIYWLHKAADADHAEAHFQLSKIYRQSSPQDSLRWRASAALLGHIEAKQTLFYL